MEVRVKEVNVLDDLKSLMTAVKSVKYVLLLLVFTIFGISDFIQLLNTLHANTKMNIKLIFNSLNIADI